MNERPDQVEQPKSLTLRFSGRMADIETLLLGDSPLNSNVRPIWRSSGTGQKLRFCPASELLR
jgi:hypothetical protein